MSEARRHNKYRAVVRDRDGVSRRRVLSDASPALSTQRSACKSSSEPNPTSGYVPRPMPKGDSCKTHTRLRAGALVLGLEFRCRSPPKKRSSACEPLYTGGRWLKRSVSGAEDPVGLLHSGPSSRWSPCQVHCWHLEAPVKCQRSHRASLPHKSPRPFHGTLSTCHLLWS